MPRIAIKFDNKNEAQGVKYLTGETILGTIIFNNEKNYKISYLSLTFSGIAEFFIDAAETDCHKETILNDKKYLIGSNDFLERTRGRKSFHDAEGLNKYNFSFNVPYHLPSSVDETNGIEITRIRYCVNAKVEYDDTSSKISQCEFPVTIINRIKKLNPYHLKPKSYKSANCLSHLLKPFKMSVETPSTAFVEGEKVKFNVNYNNQSDSEVFSTKIELVKFNRYKMKNHKGVEKSIVASSNFLGVSAKECRNIEVNLTIPSVLPSSDESCNILKIFYEIHVTADFGPLTSSYKIKVPIIIGTSSFPSPHFHSPYYKETSKLSLPSSMKTSVFSLKSAAFSYSTPESQNQSREPVGWNLDAISSTAHIPFQPVRSSSISIPSNETPPPSYYEAMKGNRQLL